MSEASYEQQKEAHGKWATFAWIASGIYLFATTDSAEFLSWQAAAFFIVGMFAAALIFGAGGYLAQRGLAKVLVKMVPTPGPGTANLVRGLGVLLFAGEAVVVFLAARWMLARLL